MNSTLVFILAHNRSLRARNVQQVIHDLAEGACPLSLCRRSFVDQRVFARWNINAEPRTQVAGQLNTVFGIKTPFPEDIQAREDFWWTPPPCKEVETILKRSGHFVSRKSGSSYHT